MKQSTSSSVRRQREGDVIGDDNDAFHQTSSSRNDLFTKQWSKRKTQYSTMRSFHMRVAILHAIFVLVSRNGVGAAAQDTLALVLQASNETTDEIPLELMPEDDNGTEGKVEIPDYFFPQPSATPSIVPSMLPSVFPSSPPTTSIEPSMVPSAFPSSVPTTIPTMYPTVTPVPTDQPSTAPTDLPSSTPSEMPSMTPTLSCHDVAAYRSPINNLTCDDHANTDCTSWRFLGLDVSDLQELVESCPITCDVPCGYFTLLNSNVSFVISNAPGLIDDVTSRTPLEEATREYLTDFIVEASPITKFALTQVTLLSQQPLNSTASSMENGQQRRLPPRLRRLANGTTAEEDSIHLQVILNLQGYKIYPIRIVLTDLLVAAIDSPDYTTQLRHAHSFFANVTASSAAMAQPRVVTAPDPPEDEMLSTITIVAVTVVIACVAIIAAVLFVKHARVRRGCKRGLPTDVEETPQQSTGSIRGNVFSFDLSPASSTRMGRLLAVLSSDSRASTSPTTSDEEAVQSSQKSTATEEHPYTGIIPPMVVIDNIEKQDPNASTMSIPETAHKKKKHIVPTKRMEASDSFIEALNNSQAGTNQGISSTLPEMMYSISSLGSGPRGDSSNNNLLSPGQRALSAILSGDGTNADDSSVSSTPVKGTDMHLDVAPRRTLSSGQLADEVDVDAVLDEFLVKRQWEYNGQNDDTSSEEDVSPTHRAVKSASYDRPSSKALHAKHCRSGSWDKHSALDRAKVPRRPFAAKTTKQTSRRSFKRSNSQTSLTSSRNSGTSPTRKRSQSRASSRGSQSSEELFAPDSEILYVYETSHRGYLGLAIEPCRRGTRIKAVKDYSPLFGLVEAGDRIMNVDGVDITYKTTAGVAELLKRKQGRNKKIRLTVARKTNETGGISTLPIMTRSRSKSLGSPVQVPSPSKPAAAPTHYASGLSPVTGLVSSITELATSPTGDEPVEEEEEEVPFHFIGAAASEDPDYESFSDPGF